MISMRRLFVEDQFNQSWNTERARARPSAARRARSCRPSRRRGRPRSRGRRGAHNRRRDRAATSLPSVPLPGDRCLVGDPPWGADTCARAVEADDATSGKPVSSGPFHGLSDVAVCRSVTRGVFLRRAAASETETECGFGDWWGSPARKSSETTAGRSTC